MTAREVREKYINFFKSSPRNHMEISPAPLVLESDPTTLFTSSGMQPLVPYLLGEPHPSGSKRLVDSQPSIRTVDIEEVGDNRHLTFFEMLGNWSLGDYFKEEQLNWVFEFFTKELGLPKEKLWVSVFGGGADVPRDEEAAVIWKKLGIPEERIFYYPVAKNWWSMTGAPEEMGIGDIGGPDSEVFYDFGEDLRIHEKSRFKDGKCHPNCDCGRFLEIGNSVFIQYKKIGEGKLEDLPQKNVDFGGGLERITAATENDLDVFKTDLYADIIARIEELTGQKYQDEQNKKAFRIIADHFKAATFLIENSVEPSNKLQGYVLRRLLRRAAVKIRGLSRDASWEEYSEISADVLRFYEGMILGDKKIVDLAHKDHIKDVIREELKRFAQTLDKGLKEVEKISVIDGRKAFDLYQTYGFPLEITEEIFEEKGQKIDREEFNKEFERHKDLSRTTSAGVFKGGLADHSPEVIRLHTATHLLLASLREVLGNHIVQKGQNITKERSRFDFPNSEKLTVDQLKRVEDMINDVVKKDLPVNFKIMPRDEAEATGAIHAFNEKYAATVKVYYVGDNLENAFSKEFCGGPHVSHTGEIGRVRIKKQEKIGSGLMRIYVVLV